MIDSINIQFNSLILAISVILRVITAGILLSVVIPLQIKQVHVRNGLIKLRKELLVTSLVLFHINTLGLTVILLRPFVTQDQIQFVTNAITIFNSIGLVCVAYLLYEMYHTQYSEESKENHDRFDKFEKKQYKALVDKTF